MQIGRKTQFETQISDANNSVCPTLQGGVGGCAFLAVFVQENRIDLTLYVTRTLILFPNGITTVTQHISDWLV
jgi:hypothetical protein